MDYSAYYHPQVRIPSYHVQQIPGWQQPVGAWWETLRQTGAPWWSGSTGWGGYGSFSPYLFGMAGPNPVESRPLTESSGQAASRIQAEQACRCTERMETLKGLGALEEQLPWAGIAGQFTLSGLQLYAGAKAEHPLPRWILYVSGGLGMFGALGAALVRSAGTP